jgi:hypothetical protein
MEMDMATSISVTETTRNELLLLKVKEGYSSMEALLRHIIVMYKKQRLLEESGRFRQRMLKRKIAFKDLVE